MTQGIRSLLDKLPESVWAEANRLAEANERRLLKNQDHIRMQLLQAAVHGNGDPIGAMRRELADMRALHERWLVDLREERKKRRTP